MYQTIKAFHEDYKIKKISAVELTKDYLKKIKSSQLNAYLIDLEVRALNQAEAADDFLSKNGESAFIKKPLLGVPMGIKDILTMDGVQTTCGSKIIKNYIPPYTATSVKRLEDAGAISLGKLNLDEFAMGGSNENSAFGPVQHPTHPGYVPGGSSGGSASAVGADLCQAALGTDTGGSIRLPASFCGIVGLKPSYGRISRSGLIAFASSLDQIGPMTKSVQDAALLLDIMSGQDEFDGTTAPLPATQTYQELSINFSLSGLRIGVPKEYFVDGISDSVKSSVEKSIQWFEGKGAKLIPISLPNTKYSVAVYYIVAVSEASSNLARFDGVRFGVRPQAAQEASDPASFYKKVRTLFGSEVKRRIILGTFALSSGYYDAYYRRACQVRHLIKKDFDRAFENVDLIMSPVSPSTAYKIGEKSSDPLKMYLNDIFTIPVNLSGLPAISIPCGKDATGLPIGLHITGSRFNETKLVQVAHAFESRQS